MPKLRAPYHTVYGERSHFNNIVGGRWLTGTLRTSAIVPTTTKNVHDKQDELSFNRIQDAESKW